MLIRIAHWASLLSTAVTLSPLTAHVFELPNKLALDGPLLFSQRGDGGIFYLEPAGKCRLCLVDYRYFAVRLAKLPLALGDRPRHQFRACPRGVYSVVARAVSRHLQEIIDSPCGTLLAHL